MSQSDEKTVWRLRRLPRAVFGARKRRTVLLGVWSGLSLATQAARWLTRLMRRFLLATTGHAEAAQIFFDPKVISYREILEIFFTIHDPTSLNRQGADVGTQYRSAIFYHNEIQKAEAEKLIDELTKEGIWDKPIVTAVEPLKVFYKAETYHKDYYKKHPKEPYCQVVIAPKIAKLQHHFIDKIKAPL